MAEAETDFPSGRHEPAWGIVERHLALAATLARPFRRYRVPVEDLEAEGRIGLFEAALRFDPDHNAGFPTYASFWVLKRIREAIAASSSIVRAPRRRGESPRTLAREVSLDDPGAGDEDRPLRDRIAQTLFPLPDRAAVEQETLVRLTRMLDALPPRERALLVLRFGLDGEPPRPLGEIALEFGISRERVHQIERRAIGRLRTLREIR